MTLNEFEEWYEARPAALALKGKGVRIAASTLSDKGRRGLLPSHVVNGYRVFRLSELLAHFEREAEATAKKKAAGR